MMIQSTTTSTPSGVGILQIGCVHVSYLYRICKRVCGWKQNPDSLQNFLPRFSPALSVTLMASSCQDGNKYSGDPLQPIRIAGIMQGLNYMTVYMHVSNHMHCNVIKLGCKSVLKDNRSSLWVCIKHVISWNNMGRCTTPTTQRDTQLADHAAIWYLSWLGPTRSPSVRGSVTRPGYGGYCISIYSWMREYYWPGVLQVVNDFKPPWSSGWKYQDLPPQTLTGWSRHIRTDVGTTSTFADVYSHRSCQTIHVWWVSSFLRVILVFGLSISSTGVVFWIHIHAYQRLKSMS